MLRQIAMEEGVFDVELMHRPIASSSQMKDGANRRRLDHRRECLVEVEARALREAADNPSGLATLETAIRMKLVLEDPSAGDDMGATRSRYKVLGSIVLEGVELVLHSLKPRRIL